jgi:hypothetical protein
MALRHAGKNPLHSALRIIPNRVPRDGTTYSDGESYRSGVDSEIGIIREHSATLS